MSDDNHDSLPIGSPAGAGAAVAPPAPADGIPWVTTRSSNVHAIALRHPFNADAAALYVMFDSGKAYRYTGPNVHRYYGEMSVAESVGRYFARHVRNCKATECVQVDATTGEVIHGTPAQQAGA